MSLDGGILGGVVAGVVAARRRGLPLLRLLDYAAPALGYRHRPRAVERSTIGDNLGKSTGMP